MLMALAQADADDEPSHGADGGLDDDLKYASEVRTISREEIRDRLTICGAIDKGRSSP